MKSDNLQGILITQKEDLFGYPYRKQPLKRKIKNIVKGIQHITHTRPKGGNKNAVFSANNVDGDIHETITNFSDRFRKKTN